ncbi:MAG: type IV pilus assembly protein PilV [Arenicella sp.]|jgi:type IV pilus assembly protein PilV
MYIAFKPGNPTVQISCLQAGTSLIEVLVSIIIIAIGLLGLAALQNTSLKLSYESYVRTQATFLATDMIDRIRSNPEAAENYSIDEDGTVAQISCFMGDTCSSNEMRQFDLYHWREQARVLLPNARVDISYDDSHLLYSMRIKWEDRYRNDLKEDAIDGISDESKEFVYHFQVGN